MNTPGASTDNINGLGKRGKVTYVHEKPLRPFGPPPLRGGGVFLRADKRWETVHLTTNEYSSFVKPPRQGTVPGLAGCYVGLWGVNPSVPERKAGGFGMVSGAARLG